MPIVEAPERTQSFAPVAREAIHERVGTDDQPSLRAGASAVHGRVVDEDGRPVAGARVETVAAHGEHRVTGRDGSFEFDLGVLRYLVTSEVTILAPGFARSRASFEDAVGVIDIGDIVLRPGGTVRGRVLGDAGLGLVGVEVFAMPPLSATSPYSKRSDHESFASTTTDASGRFLLQGVPAGFVDVWAQRIGKLATSAPAVTVDARLETSGVELTLRDIPDDAVITGVVLDAEGERVSRASVRFARHSESSAWSMSMSADPQGHFRLEKELEGPVSLSAWSSDIPYHSAIAPNVEPGTQDVVLQLEPPQWLEVAGRDEQGRVLAADEIIVTNRVGSERGGRGLRPAELRQDESSVFIACPMERFVLIVKKHGDQSVEIGPLWPDTAGDRVEVLFVRLPVLAGTVTVSGEAIEGAEVALYAPVPDGQEYVRERFPVLWLQHGDHTTTTDSKGRFTLMISEEQIHGARRMRRFGLRATKIGFAPDFSRTFTLDAGSTSKELEIELSRGGTIEGRVEVPAGTSPAGTIVGASNGDGEIHFRRAPADGSFRFDRLTPGDWILQKMKTEHGFGEGTTGGGHATRTAEPVPWSCSVRDDQVTYFDLDLRRTTGARLNGSVTIDGLSPGPWRVRIGMPFERSMLVRSRVPGATTLDPNGGFTLEGIPAGECTLSVRDEDSMTHIIQALTLANGDQFWRVDLERATLAGRIDRELSGNRIVHEATGPSGALVRTQIEVDHTGTFRSVVPVGAGTLRDTGGGRVLLEVHVPRGGVEGVVVE